MLNQKPRNQGGKPYEGEAPIATEDGGVLYPGLKYTSQGSKTSWITFYYW